MVGGRWENIQSHPSPPHPTPQASCSARGWGHADSFLLPHPRGKGFVFLSEEEKTPVLQLPCNGDEQHFATLLGDLAHTDITSVYRLGECPLSLDPSPWITWRAPRSGECSGGNSWGGGSTRSMLSLVMEAGRVLWR